MAAHPVYTLDEARGRAVFLALMWSISYPGTAHELPADGDPLELVGLALLDLETSFYTPQADLAARLARTGARALEPERAAYHFYPRVDALALNDIARASVGTTAYPDQAATLIIGAAFGAGARLTLTGAGVNGAAHLQIDGLPAALWTLRARVSFPLGWDMFLIDGRSVIGVPRSTRVTFDK